MKRKEKCPQCGAELECYRNPLPTVDIIIELDSDIVLIERRNPPYGWALPGGFVEEGESLEAAAIREAREETSLEVTLLGQFHTYSDPNRDPRRHTISTVFRARGQGVPRAADDAKGIGIFTRANLPTPLAFDHARIITDYFAAVEHGGITSAAACPETTLPDS